MITSLLIAFFSGMLTNYTNKMVNKISQAGWRSVSLYLIRTTLKIPSILMINKHLKDKLDKDELSLVAYILASSAYGMGIITGWLLDEA